MESTGDKIKPYPRFYMHILFATEYLPPYVSGISNRCKNLINGYRERGHTVTVCSVQGTNCDIVVPSLPNPFYAHQRTFSAPPWGLMKQLLDFSQPVPFDICHIVAPLCFSFIWVIPFLRLRGVKIYVSYHVYLEFYYQHYVGSNPWLFAFFESLFAVLYFLPLVYLADCVGIPSKTADKLVFKYAKRIHYLKSGLDTQVFRPDRVENPSHFWYNRIESVSQPSDYTVSNIRALALDGPLLIYVGRLAPEKNVEFLIQALTHPKLQDASLCIVGDGPSRLNLEKLARSMVGDQVYSGTSSKPFGHRVIFMGMILDEKQVAQYYSQSDLFVSASASETFGFTVAEAMACGTPAVVVRSGAFETVYAMIDDWMFEKGQMDDFAMDDFANKAEAALSSPSHRQLARDIAVKGFGVQHAIDDFLDTYTTISKVTLPVHEE